MGSASNAPAISPDVRRDAVTAAALTTVRRALVEGVPITRESLEREASINLDATPAEAMREVDAVAQRLGISSLG